MFWFATEGNGPSWSGPRADFAPGTKKRVDPGERRGGEKEKGGTIALDLETWEGLGRRFC